MISVVVGQDPGVGFTVNEDLICASSAFFKCALSRDWKESQLRSVRLEEDDPAIFRSYMKWLNEVASEPDSKGERQWIGPYRIANKNWSQGCMTLVKAYVLADRLQDVDFADSIMETLVSKTLGMNECIKIRWPSFEAVNYIFSNTIDTSPAQGFLVDIWTVRGQADLLSLVPHHDLPNAFLHRLAVALLKLRGSDRTCDELERELWCHGKITCKYHVKKRVRVSATKRS